MPPGRALSRILVAVDFGMSSAAALAYAHQLAEHLRARLVALYVDEDGWRNGDARTPAGTMDIFATQAAPNAVDCERIVVHGSPAAGILETAADSGADLIVLGSHGRGRMGRLALGSVSAAVLRDAETPVLVVRSLTELFVNGQILVGVDFSDGSRQALAMAAALAGPAHATVEVCHVLPYGEHHSPGHAVLVQEATEALDIARQEIVPPGVASRSHAAMAGMGHPAAAIAARASAIGARLIVVGGHGATGRVAGVLGGVAERLLHMARVPVLVVRPTRRSEGDRS